MPFLTFLSLQRPSFVWTLLFQQKLLIFSLLRLFALLVDLLYGVILAFWAFVGGCMRSLIAGWSPVVDVLKV